MIKYILLFTSIFFISNISFAGFTPIEKPSIVCESSGLKVAVNEAERRAWQSDPGNDDGLELNIDKFEYKDNLLTIEGVIQFEEFDSYLYEKYVIELSDNEMKLAVYIKPKKDSDYLKAISEVKCEKLPI